MIFKRADQSSIIEHILKEAQTGIIYVKNKIQKALLDGELKGQISDGHWENSSPRDHYIPWTSAKVEIGGQGTKGIYADKNNYNFTSGDLLDVVGGRMMGMARIIKKYPAAINDIHSAEGVGDYLEGTGKTEEGLASYAKEYVNKIKALTHASFDDLVATVNDVTLYSKADLIRDLNEIKKSFRTSLDAGFVPSAEEEEQPGSHPASGGNLSNAIKGKFLKTFRYFNEITSTKEPIWEQYMTVIEGTSNKFHYFAVMEKDDGTFIAGNISGKIGAATPQLNEILVGNKIDALNEAKSKAIKKIKKGYQEGSIE